MYKFDNYLYLRETGDLDIEADAVWELWVMDGSSAAAINAVTGVQGEPSAANLTSFSSLQECNWTNYARKVVPNRVVTKVTSSTPHYVAVTHDPIERTALGTGTKVVGSIWYVKGASDALSYPLLYLDPRATYPFSGGRDIFVVSPSGGSYQAY